MGSKSQQLQIRVTPEQKAALKRLARRAGVDVSRYVLSSVLPPVGDQIRSLLKTLAREDDPQFALAAFNDLLVGLMAAEFSEAVADLEVGQLSPFLKNYVAAMVEVAAHLKGQPPPDWVREVEALEEPYFAVPYARLRPYLLRAAPTPFKRRNIFVDATVGDRV